MTNPDSPHANQGVIDLSLKNSPSLQLIDCSTPGRRLGIPAMLDASATKPAMPLTHHNCLLPHGSLEYQWKKEGITSINNFRVRVECHRTHQQLSLSACRAGISAFFSRALALIVSNFS